MHSPFANRQSPIRLRKRFGEVMEKAEQIEEALRLVFDQISLFDSSITGADHPSPNSNDGADDGLLAFKFVPGSTDGAVILEFSDTLTQWLSKLCGGHHQPDSLSRRRIETVICKILNEKIPKFTGPHVDLCNLRGWGPVDSSSLHLPVQQLLLDGNILSWLRGVVALDPGGMSNSWTHWNKCNIVLRTRRLLLQRTPPTTATSPRANPLPLPSPKRQRIQRCLSEGSKDAADMGRSQMEKTDGTLNFPNRRSQRRHCLLRTDEAQLVRKRVPSGPFFQADVPERKCSELYKITSDRKWLGTRLWPPEGKDIESIDKPVGEGRSDSCSCSCAKSAECVKFHVRMARIRLSCELGLSFQSMGFDNMGEEVSRSWSLEEQLRFDAILRTDGWPYDKTCLYPPLTSFSKKSMQQVVSYYFNVHLLRWMSSKTRRTHEEVDSDDGGRSRLA